MVNAKKQLEDFQEQLQTMHANLEAVQAENQELTSHINELNNKIAAGLKREDDLKNQNESLKSSLLDTNEALESFKKQNEDIQHELEDKNTRLESTVEKIETLEEELEKLKIENGKIQEDMENTTASSQKISSELKQKIDRLQKYISELESKDSQSQKAINELSSTGREQSAQIKSLQKEIKDKDQLQREKLLLSKKFNLDVVPSDVEILPLMVLRLTSSMPLKLIILWSYTMLPYSRNSWNIDLSTIYVSTTFAIALIVNCADNPNLFLIS